jgi:hypothetical protein
MKKTACFISVVLSFFISNAVADIISGTVTDSTSGQGLFHVKVGTDSAHFVLTDSTGKFLFNTDGNVGTLNRTDRPGGIVFWNPAEQAFFLPGNSGDVTIQVINMRGVLISTFTSIPSSTESRFPLSALPTGIYIASINSKGKITFLKFMISHGFSNLSFKAGMETGKIGLGKFSAVHATTILNFQKPTYYKAAKAVTGSQSDMAIKLQEDFSLSRHDFLTAAEWQCNNGDCEHNQKMYLVRGGKVVWTYTEPLACEFDDVWMLSDGSITMSLRYGGRKIRSIQDTSTSWYVFENVQTQGETHVVQPISLNKVFMVVNQGNHVSGFIINTQTGDTLRTWAIPSGNTNFHSNLRHCRITKEGTMVCTHFDLNKVSEYDTSTMKELWTCPVRGWAGVKLRNGNMLISGDGGGWVREINRTTKNVDWEIYVKDLPNVTFGSYIQGIQRCANGNTIINNCNGSPSILEVSPDKKVVWSVSTAVIPNSSGCQILDEEGIPEKPGDLLR